MKNSWFKNCLVNLRAFFTTNLRQRDNEAMRRIARLETSDLCIRTISYYNLMTYFASHPEEALPYRQEIEYLQHLGHWTTFPYETVSPAGAQVEPPQGAQDLRRGQRPRGGGRPRDKDGMPFVLHDSKKLFFPRGTSANTLRQQYHNYLYDESLLGRDDKEGHPHQYQSPRVQVEPGDVLFDIGAAEGLFALDNIGRADRIVVVESDPTWYEALQTTFAPWADKVTIVRKKLGTFDDDTTVSLSTLLATYGGPSSFVKMDIEGAETEVMEAFLRLRDFKTLRLQTLKISLATYHRQDDHRRLKEDLTHAGFSTEASTGYMLFCEYDIPLPPFFRKGILRTKIVISE